MEIHDPMDTIAFELNLSYPKAATKEGEYAFMVITGAIPAMVRIM